MDPDAMDIPTAIASIGALGTAAFGLVDAAKAFRGGPSNFGFGFIVKCLEPFKGALAIADTADNDAFMQTLRANWLNGVPMAEQKATAKSLIHLGLIPRNAAGLATATGIPEASLAEIARKIEAGSEFTPNEVSVFGRFDVIVSAKLDAGFQLADQRYRNASKALACGVSVVLALIAARCIGAPLWQGFLVGIVATAVAPVAKDLASTFAAAVKAVSAVKR